MSDINNKFAETFRQEAEELLTTVEESILDVEQDPQNMDAINRLFRAMHTIKGSGGMFGFDEVSRFTHHVESALDKVRNGQAPVTRELTDLILASRDQIMAMLEGTLSGNPVDPGRSQEIIAALERVMGGHTEASTAAAAGKSAPRHCHDGGHEKTWQIRFAPNEGLFVTGTDPANLLDELRCLGECDITMFTDKVPALEQYDAEKCYLYWDILLTTGQPEEAIRDVFIFVEGDSQITIRELAGTDEPAQDDTPPKLGEILVERGECKKEDVHAALNQQSRLGDLLVRQGVVTPEKVQSALKEQKTLQQQKTTEQNSSVRVASDKLDRLINLVGELVITQAQLTEIGRRSALPELSRPVEEIERLTAELRDSVLNIRMMPIGSTFNRYRRLVRDLSGELGKEIDLITEGADTELDKTVIERLGDPLVHLIRNSIDHGIEQPAERQAAGKEPHGVIRLCAEHRGANVVITIEDDGKGLDEKLIRAKAVEKGLIAADTELSQNEIYKLIFAPGFSTAARVTSVSGRGVGMDVVKREIEALRGSINIHSRKGKGTTIEMSLPLTLAIIDGLLVEVGGNRFVVPVSAVEECIEMNRSNYLNANRNIIQIRGEMIPYIRLREVFQIAGDIPPVEETVIVNCFGTHIGLVVDHIIGDHQTVIKSLGKIYRRVEGVSAATIMGDGSVALILDVAGLVRCAEAEEKALVCS